MQGWCEAKFEANGCEVDGKLMRSSCGFEAKFEAKFDAKLMLHSCGFEAKLEANAC